MFISCGHLLIDRGMFVLTIKNYITYVSYLSLSKIKILMEFRPFSYN